MKIILVTLSFALIAILGVLFYAVFGSRTTIDKEEITSSCIEDVKAAQESSQGLMCTQIIKILMCPRDTSFVYEAPNGCEISSLEQKGWR